MIMKSWRYIQEDQVSAYNGLATDEYLMDMYSQDVLPTQATLRLYTYREFCCLVGRFQNIHAELNLEACRSENAQYSRRLTGGGAIIMGDGQLGICLATNHTFDADNTKAIYQLFAQPVILALSQIGIKAHLKGKNDLVVDGKKIAGLGIHVNHQGAIQFHTSLLVNLNVEKMLRVLNIPLQKIADKRHLRKVEQRITTVSRELNRVISIDEMRKRIKDCYRQLFDVNYDTIHITTQERIKINKLADDRYNNEDWIFQNSPQPDMTGMGLKKSKAGLLRTYVALKGETIKSVLITGDFFGLEKLFSAIESKLKWHPIDKEKILGVIEESFALYGAPEDLQPKEVFDSIWRASLGAMREVQYTYSGSCYYPKTDAEQKQYLKNRIINEILK